MKRYITDSVSDGIARLCDRSGKPSFFKACDLPEGIKEGECLVFYKKRGWVFDEKRTEKLREKSRKLLKSVVKKKNKD